MGKGIRRWMASDMGLGLYEIGCEPGLADPVGNLLVSFRNTRSQTGKEAELQTITTLTGVKDRKSGQSARGPWTLTIFSAADGREYSTLKGDVASAAEALVGQLATVEYSERQNGKFTNYSLESISAAPEGATASPVASGGKNGEFRTPAQNIRSTAVEVVAVTQAFDLSHDVEGFLTAAAVIEKYITEGLEDEPEA